MSSVMWGGWVGGREMAGKEHSQNMEELSIFGLSWFVFSLHVGRIGTGGFLRFFSRWCCFECTE